MRLGRLHGKARLPPVRSDAIIAAPRKAGSKQTSLMPRKDIKKESEPIDPRRHSRLVVDGLKQAPSRAMLRAVGFTDADFAKPQIGIASTWSMVTPCNMHIDGLAREAAAGAERRGWQERAFQYDYGVRRHLDGHPGMRYSLVSREVIADSIETVVAARRVRRDRDDRRLRQEHARLRDGDGPPESAVDLRLWRHDPCRDPRNSRDIISVFEAVGSHAAGKIDDAELKEVESTAIPGPGSCGGMYTANTMASAIEALGHEPCEQLGAGGGFGREERGLPAGRRGRRGTRAAADQAVATSSARRLSRTPLRS